MFSCCVASMNCSMFRNPVIRKSAAKILSRYPELGDFVGIRECRLYIVASKDGKQIFVTGHSEYDPLSLEMGV